MGQTYAVFVQLPGGRLQYLGEAFGYSTEEAMGNAKEQYRFRTTRPILNSYPTRH